MNLLPADRDTLVVTTLSLNRVIMLWELLQRRANNRMYDDGGILTKWSSITNVSNLSEPFDHNMLYVQYRYCIPRNLPQLPRAAGPLPGLHPASYGTGVQTLNACEK